MPTIEVSYKDLVSLIGRKMPFDELKQAVQYSKAEIEGKEGDTLKIEVKDSNRPELWSAEGIAREIRQHYKRLPVFNPVLKKSGLKVIVDNNLKNIRPLTVCAVVTDLKIKNEALNQMIQLQEKICETFGLKRKEVALGIYDYSKITSPINYKACDPDEIKFVPLGFDKKLSLRKILQMHPKGREYAHLLADKKKYPVFIDSAGEVLSMPPIINSDHTGNVTEKTKDLFIECSGFNYKFLLPALNAVVAALIERGGRAESVQIIYGSRKMITPDLKPKKISLDIDYLERIAGQKYSKKRLAGLLAKCGFGCRFKAKKAEIIYPAYRQDIMHQIDVVEDVLIAEGFNQLKPETIRMPSLGKMLEIERFSDEIKELMVGLGAQEVLSYILTNKDALLKRMCIEEMKIIEIGNPVSKNWSVFRTWIIPSLMELLSKNTHREYPQQVFEVGQVVLPDDKAETMTKNPVRMAWAYTGKDSDFTKAKQALDYLMNSLGLEYSIKESEHASFIRGRFGRAMCKGVEIGFVGEIHPQVLECWNLKMPVAGFEIDLIELLNIVGK